MADEDAMPGVQGVFQGRFGRVTLFETDHPVHEHAHPHVHALFKVAGRDGSYSVAGDDCALTDDEIVLVNPLIPHANRRRAGGPSTTILALYLDPQWFGEAVGRPRTVTPFSRPSARATQKLRRLAGAVATSLTCSENPLDIEADLFELCRSIPAEGADAASAASPTRTLDRRVRHAMMRMQANPGHPHRLDDLARIVGLSRSCFFEQFKNSVGVSPGVFLDSLRIEHAIALLIGTNRTVADIAQELAFSAQGHFTRFFKGKLGFSPTEYRRVAHQR